MTKAELRKLVKEKRRLLSAEEVETRSRQIASRFFQEFDLTGVQYLHSFLPIIRFKEVNTWPIIHLLQSDFPEIRIVFPKTNLEGLSMESILYDENILFAGNRWGITEPVQGNGIAAHLIDVILLPLLAYDLKGHRIGYGKGFYDRFLTTCRNDIIKIGLSMDEPVTNVIDDINSFDIPMDYCITPQKTWHFGRKPQ